MLGSIGAGFNGIWDENAETSFLNAEPVSVQPTCRRHENVPELQSSGCSLVLPPT